MYIKLHHKKQWEADVYLKKVTSVSSACIISCKIQSNSDLVRALDYMWWRAAYSLTATQNLTQHCMFKAERLIIGQFLLRLSLCYFWNHY